MNSAEVAHILFLDIVGYSKEVTSSQSRLATTLKEIVEDSEAYQVSKQHNLVIPISTGDGMALVFFHDLTLPIGVAQHLQANRNTLGARVRMGIHSGVVQRQTDIAGQVNFSGEGINIAQRIMDAAGPDEILLSEQYALWLLQFEGWNDKIGPVQEIVAKHGVKLKIARYGQNIKNSPIKNPVANTAIPQKKLVVLYRRKAQPDEQLVFFLEEKMKADGFELFIDRHLKIGVEWAKVIEEKIRAADAVIALISDASSGSEMLEFELEIALEELRSRGAPMVLPIRIGTKEPCAGTIGSLVNKLHFVSWQSTDDNDAMINALKASIFAPVQEISESHFEPVGGAVSVDSPFYIERESDRDCTLALTNKESIILIKGPRQMGKTSLIGRCVHQFTSEGVAHLVTDFQKLSSSQIASEDIFYKVLSRTFARQLKFQYDFESEWLDVFGPNLNMDNLLRAYLESQKGHLIWFMDEADKLFGAPFASDFFGLVRSWHNARATEPDGPWSRFTVVVSYATEAHMFIKDINQSPFNVGLQIPLRLFNLAEVEELNRRYGSPIKSASEISEYMTLVEGHPFLTRRGLDVIARKRLSFRALMDTADQDSGPFGDHLKRILMGITANADILQALQESISNPAIRELPSYQSMLAAGIFRNNGPHKVEFRCDLYRRYLTQHLHPQN